MQISNLKLESEGQKKKSICTAKKGGDMAWHFGRQSLKRGVAGTASTQRLRSTKCSIRSSTMVCSFYGKL